MQSISKYTLSTFFAWPSPYNEWLFSCSLILTQGEGTSLLVVKEADSGSLGLLLLWVEASLDTCKKTWCLPEVEEFLQPSTCRWLMVSSSLLLAGGWCISSNSLLTEGWYVSLTVCLQKVEQMCFLKKSAYRRWWVPQPSTCRLLMFPPTFCLQTVWWVSPNHSFAEGW